MHIQVIRLNRLWSRSFHVSGCWGSCLFQAELPGIKGIPYVNSSIEHHCLSLLNLAIPYGGFFFKSLRAAAVHTHIQVIHYCCTMEVMENSAYETPWSRCRVKGLKKGVLFLVMDGLMCKVIYKNVFIQQ